jgi:hypothetical protein
MEPREYKLLDNDWPSGLCSLRSSKCLEFDYAAVSTAIKTIELLFHKGKVT